MPYPVAAARGRGGAIAAAAGGWWVVAGQTCVAAYAPKGAASLAASYVNLANPGTYDLTEGTAPAFNTAIGWTFAGNSSQFLKCAYNPTIDTSVIVRFSNVTYSPDYPALFGEIRSPTYGFYFHPMGNAGDQNHYYIHGATAAGGTRVVVAGNLTDGIAAIAGQAKAYLGGSPEGTFTSSSYTSPSNGIAIGARVINASTQNAYLSGAIQAIAFYSTVLTDADVSTLTTRMAAL